MKSRKILQFIIALIAIFAITMPIGVAFAEDPTHLSEVDDDNGWDTI